MKLLQIKTQITLDDFEYFNRWIKMRRSLLYHIYVDIIVLFILVLLNVTGFQQEDPQIALLIVLDIIVLAMLIGPFFIKKIGNAKKDYENVLIYQKPFEINFYDDYIQQVNLLEEMRINYDQINKVVEKTNYFYVMYKKRLGLIIRKEDISQSEMLTLKEIFTSKLANKRISFYK